MKGEGRGSGAGLGDDNNAGQNHTMLPSTTSRRLASSQHWRITKCFWRTTSPWSLAVLLKPVHADGQGAPLARRAFAKGKQRFVAPHSMGGEFHASIDSDFPVYPDWPELGRTSNNYGWRHPCPERNPISARWHLPPPHRQRCAPRTQPKSVVG